MGTSMILKNGWKPVDCLTQPSTVTGAVPKIPSTSNSRTHSKDHKRHAESVCQPLRYKKLTSLAARQISPASSEKRQRKIQSEPRTLEQKIEQPAYSLVHGN
ncbi:hypothetical protein PROFUN_00347 [Planoprotostelium fungivorum]|uniref:Uncharacterized protein n=1 Tax=Planoprotostelium fungivorum TaxID=1890364 RepID=A0A2P6NY59_9EUKA|nr:hypothetical protein PROFUN_00347 [Planoprotostelium fungivorum]